MKTSITIEARRFPVTIRDERTGKIIQAYTVLDKRQLQAAELVGQSSKELICRQYTPQGYKVLEIGTAERRTITVDLNELWKLHCEAERGEE